jgi:hypothetical protein
MTLLPPPGRRRYRTWEQQFLGEWMARYRPDARVLTHVRLGPIRPATQGVQFSALEMQALGLWRRWADALVILPDRLELVEAKILQSPAQNAQLELYAHLLPDTPELVEFRGRRLDKVALVALEDPAATFQARKAGIQVIVWRPPWMDEWMAARDARQRRAPRFEPSEEAPG